MLNRFCLTALLFLLLAIPAAQAAEAPLIKVKVTEAIHGVFFLPLYLAQGLKFFEKQGLDVEIITTEAGPLAMQALLSGEVQFCATGHGLVANMYRKGQSTKIVNVMQDRCTFYLMGRPEVADIPSLKGQSVGVTKVGAESFAIARAILARAGLDPEKDATLVGVGGMATTASALVNNRCQAVVGWQPLTARFLAEGKSRNLARLNTAEDSLRYLGYPSYSFTIIQVTDAYLQQHAPIVQRFVNALVATEKWLAGRSSAELARAAAPYFPGLAPELLEASIEQDRAAFSTTGLVSPEGHESVVKVWLDAKILDQPVPFQAIVDNSFSQKAQN